MENNKGYLLGNRYRLLDQIGEGGMANVYLATDTILNREVAIKVLRGDLSNDETFVKRFQREALSATTLEHPNLVQIYDVGEEQGYHYIVMEYIEGKTLKQLIKQYGPLSIGEVIDVMEQLVSAVEHAHSRGVIHRDIKPQNIIVRSDGTVKLTDFGIAIAQNAAQLTQTNNIMGSVHYLAPELAKGHMATAQSDIYSLGIVMFELLAGHVPFAGESAVNIALMHMEDEMPSIRKIVGHDKIGQAVENVILKATMKNKKYRYKTAHDMLEDLSTANMENRANEPKYEVEADEVDDNTTIVMDKNNIAKGSKKRRINLTKKQKRGLIGAGIISAFLLAFIIFGLLNPTKPMPDVIGMTYNDAIIELEDAGFSRDEYKITKEEIESDDVENGMVAETKPRKGEGVSKNTEIILRVSTGKKVEMPNLIGQTQSEATATLDSLKILYNISYKESDQTPGTVIKTNPPAGTKVKEGSSVDLVIAVEEKITVINVIGLTYGTASARLQELGFIVTSSGCTERDTVKSQSIPGGRKAKKNSKIKLTCDPKDSADANNGKDKNNGKKN
jgi:eukaryotic-like serine/threonine-protein kinase